MLVAYYTLPMGPLKPQIKDIPVKVIKLLYGRTVWSPQRDPVLLLSAGNCELKQVTYKKRIYNPFEMKQLSV